MPLELRLKIKAEKMSCPEIGCHYKNKNSATKWEKKLFKSQVNILLKESVPAELSVF